MPISSQVKVAFPNIKAEMGRRGETNGSMAKVLGMSVVSYGYKLQGKREFTLAEVHNLAEHFETSIDYLVAR